MLQSFNRSMAHVLLMAQVLVEISQTAVRSTHSSVTRYVGGPVSGRPLWYTQIHFNAPRPVALVLLAADVPDRPGCYVFTETAGPLVPQHVLYVGRALSLRARVRGYLVDYMQTAPTKHKGRAFIFDARHQRGDGQVFLRWTIYGDPTQLEASLIEYLQPACNDRDEANPFADDEPLNSLYRL